MTIVVNPFWAGVVTTILAEIILIFVMAIGKSVGSGKGGK